VLAPLVVIAYLGLAFSKSIWAIGFIFIFYLVRGIRIPLFNAYINELVPSHIRATVLSVGRFVNRMIFVIFGPFIGWFADVYTMEQAFLMSALFFFICCGVSLFFMRKCKTI
jgi:MFS family permease